MSGSTQGMSTMARATTPGQIGHRAITQAQQTTAASPDWTTG